MKPHTAKAIATRYGRNVPKRTLPTKLTNTPNPGESGFEGYHKFGLPDRGSKQYGSFEIWYGTQATLPDGCEPGWYWHACFPGCLPDGEPSGPFPTSEGAYLDAIGD